MRKLWLLLTVFILAATTGFAQQAFEVKGVVADTAGQPLQGVSVRLLQGKDSSLSITDKSGSYFFKQVNTNSFTVKYTYTGLKPVTQSFTKTNNGSVFQVEPVILLPSTGTLDSVVITSVRPIIIKEDTIQYNVSAYRSEEHTSEL